LANRVEALLSSDTRQSAPLATSWIRGACNTRRVLLDAPFFYERAGVHDIKLELVEQIGDRFFCSGVTSACGTSET
jgi:hypothetical protein